MADLVTTDLATMRRLIRSMLRGEAQLFNSDRRRRRPGLEAAPARFGRFGRTIADGTYPAPPDNNTFVCQFEFKTFTETAGEQTPVLTTQTQTVIAQHAFGLWVPEGTPVLLFRVPGGNDGDSGNHGRRWFFIDQAPDLICGKVVDDIPAAGWTDCDRYDLGQGEIQLFEKHPTVAGRYIADDDGYAYAPETETVWNPGDGVVEANKFVWAQRNRWHEYVIVVEPCDAVCEEFA